MFQKVKAQISKMGMHVSVFIFAISVPITVRTQNIGMNTRQLVTKTVTNGNEHQTDNDCQLIKMILTRKNQLGLLKK